MKKIKYIQTALSDENSTCKVGEYGVTEIMKVSQGVDNVYEVWKGEQLWFRFENVPMIVNYFMSEEE